MAKICNKCGEAKDFEYCESCNVSHCMCDYDKHSKHWDRDHGRTVWSEPVKVRGGNCAVIALVLFSIVTSLIYGLIEVLQVII